MPKATVVNVGNFVVGPEFKPGVFPSHYTVPAADEDGLGILVVEDAWHDMYLHSGKTMRLTVPVREIAEAIVVDFIRAQLQADDVAHPGLFWKEGELDSEDIRREYADEVERAVNSHRLWATKLVKMADDLWQETRKRKVISTTMVNAAAYLGYNDREWSKLDLFAAAKKCPVCAAVVDPIAIVCQTCKAILDKAKYDEFEFAR